MWVSGKSSMGFFGVCALSCSRLLKRAQMGRGWWILTKALVLHSSCGGILLLRERQEDFFLSVSWASAASEAVECTGRLHGPDRQISRTAIWPLATGVAPWL